MCVCACASCACGGARGAAWRRWTCAAGRGRAACRSASPRPGRRSCRRSCRCARARHKSSRRARRDCLSEGAPPPLAEASGPERAPPDNLVDCSTVPAALPRAS
eukprot:1135431-Pleurochrysis_carterae.AAC.3